MRAESFSHKGWAALTQGTYQLEAASLPWLPQAGIEGFWQQFAQASLAWLAQQGVPPRDAVVLLPFAQHLGMARRAFAHQCVWPPRLETTRSLASALGPQPLAVPGQLSGNDAVDALAAAERLGRAGLLVGADARSQRVRAQRLLALALALRRAADAISPAQRAGYWLHAARELAGQGAEPLEAALAQEACRWAQAGPEPATDALFAHPVRAWVVLEVGRPDALARALVQGRGDALCLTLAAPDVVPQPAWRQATLPDVAALAQATAAQVLAAVERAETPVLLPATDRALVRRVLALLAPHGLQVTDETGSSLATLAPAAALRHLVRSAIQGGMDDTLAWAKSPLAPTGLDDVSQLETWARRHHHTQWQGDIPVQAPGLSWRRMSQAVAPLRDGPARRPLSDWLLALRDVLLRCDALAGERWPTSVDQAQWRTLCEALWLTRSPWPGSALAHTLGTGLTADQWLVWLDDALQAPAPSPVSAQAAQVVVTPLARAILRPFGHCVVAGCDSARWALGQVMPALVNEATAIALHLPDRASAQEAQWQALLQLLRLPRVTWLQAAQEDGVPLEWASPLLRLRALWGGADLPPASEARVADQPAPRPLTRQAQATPGWIPARLSASQVEALRDCPYRFFGRVCLGLGQFEEIDLDPDARDTGRWLHAVLEHVHKLGDPAQHWDAACEAVLAEQGLAAGADAPFRALLQRWGPAYLAWWAAQAGTRVLATELRLTEHPWSQDPLLDKVAWTGVIDRLDAGLNGERRLLDFKAGSSSAVVEKLKDDTQLPFYAVLLALQGDPADSAAYIAYDSKTQGLRDFSSKALTERAEALRMGLAEDLRALHAGEPLRALGEGRACEHCDMRGLCRRDDWQA